MALRSYLRHSVATAAAPADTHVCFFGVCYMPPLGFRQLRLLSMEQQFAELQSQSTTPSERGTVLLAGDVDAPGLGTALRQQHPPRSCRNAAVLSRECKLVSSARRPAWFSALVECFATSGSAHFREWSNTQRLCHILISRTGFRNVAAPKRFANIAIIFLCTDSLVS